MRFFLSVVLLLLVACNVDKRNVELSKNICKTEIKDSSLVQPAVVEKIIKQKEYTLYEDSLIGLGFLDVFKLDTTFVIDLKYTSADNFTDTILYTDLKHCFLQKEAINKLLDAHKKLKSKRPDLRMVLYDCLRPQNVQYKMWEIVKGTEKSRYVANPKYGSIHNFGAAVDLGLIDTLGNYKDMGSAFDEFDLIAQPRHEMEMYKQGKITREALDNRWLLKTCMKDAGFRTIQTEWWHYNAFSLNFTRQNFKIVK